MQRAPVRLVRLVTFVVAMLGLRSPPWRSSAWTCRSELQGRAIWASGRRRTALRIGVIVLLALTANRLVGHHSSSRAQREEWSEGAGPADIERRKRAQTIGSTLSRFLTTVIGPSRRC